MNLPAYVIPMTPTGGWRGRGCSIKHPVRGGAARETGATGERQWTKARETGAPGADSERKPVKLRPPLPGNMWVRALLLAALLFALCPAGRTEAERDERDVQDYSYANSNRLVGHRHTLLLLQHEILQIKYCKQRSSLNILLITTLFIYLAIYYLSIFLFQFYIHELHYLIIICRYFQGFGHKESCK